MTQEQLDWEREGIERGATYLMIVCDTFSYEDYPVFIMKDQNVEELRAEYSNQPMSRVMGITALPHKHYVLGLPGHPDPSELHQNRGSL